MKEQVEIVQCPICGVWIPITDIEDFGMCVKCDHIKQDAQDANEAIANA